jgi:hypothetical protein
MSRLSVYHATQDARMNALALQFWILSNRMRVTDLIKSLYQTASRPLPYGRLQCLFRVLSIYTGLELFQLVGKAS